MSEIIFNEEDFYNFCYRQSIYNQVEINLMYNLYNVLLIGSPEEITKGYDEVYFNYIRLKTGGFN